MLYVKPKFLFICFLSLALLSPAWGCSYKPSYLAKSRSTEISNRWKVEKMAPASLSPDESAVFSQFGPPSYIRFFRKLDPDRARTYEWIYLDPVRFFTFIDGKQIPQPALDEDSSPFNDYQKKVLFWSGVTAGSVAALGLLYYFIFGKN